jgi:hypothetical protein
MSKYSKLAMDIHEIFHELEIDEIVKGLKANCNHCDDEEANQCIVCQEFKKLNDKDDEK